jgi:hypothetical protein
MEERKVTIFEYSNGALNHARLAEDIDAFALSQN